jgi:trimethylamine:corrinoid methyltransferase-like protein
VGPIPGYYLDKAHTQQWWKKEQFIPKVADFSSISEWRKTGRRSCIDYARERMEEILANHKPTPLTAKQEAEVERILEEAKKFHQGKM